MITRPLLALGALALACSVLMGCGSNGPLTLAEWADRFCAVSNEYATITRELAETPPTPPLDLTGYQKERAREIPIVLDAARQTAAALAAIEPPGEANSYHSNARATYEALADLYAPLLPRWESAQSLDEFEEVDNAGFEGVASIEERYPLEPTSVLVEAITKAEQCHAGAVAESETLIPREAAAALLTVGDLNEEDWTATDEFSGTDYRFAMSLGEEPPRPETCPAIQPSPAPGALFGPLDVLATAQPAIRAARMFHTDTLSTLDSNLRFLARGSQIWTEVWVFYDSDATTAGETMAALREAFNTGNGPTCTETERPPPDATSERRTVSRPAFMLPDSAAYALDVLEVSERGGLFEAHVETHVIQHGTYIGLLVLYDYAPADLWSRDAERVLKLFDDQLRDAAEQ